MRGGNPDPHGALTQLEQADTMHATRLQERKKLSGLRQHLSPFDNDQRLVRLVLEALDDMTLVLVTHPALERAVTARTRVFEGALQSSCVDDGLGDFDHINRPQPGE